VHHKVEITDGAIVAAAKLSHRYITDRQLPDKAIDLIDEAASRIRMEIDSKPEVLDRLERRLIQLKIEAQALKKKGRSGAKRLEKLRKKSTGWSASTPTWRKSGSRRKPRCRVRRRSAEDRAGPPGAGSRPPQRRPEPHGRLQYGVIPELERSLQMVDQHGKSENQLLRNKVTDEEIAESCRSGPAFRCPRCSKASATSC
jgi:ATP-dependent Clp protease ATP-binding subunit ClpB